MKEEKDFAQPGLCTSDKAAGSENYTTIKSTIIPQPYSYQRLFEYIESHFDYREIYLSDIRCEIFKENISRVNQEDYDSDSLWLQELISIIENMQKYKGLI